MRKTREILRQKWELGRTYREVAASLGPSLGGVAVTLGRAAKAGIDWVAAQALSDDALEERIYGVRSPPLARATPDFEYLYAERKKPGVTLQLLHLEYLEKYPRGFRYTAFCERYRQWLKRRGLTMRQEHYAGEAIELPPAIGKRLGVSRERVRMLELKTKQFLPAYLRPVEHCAA